MREMLVWIVLLYLRFFAWVALVIHRPYVIGIAGSVGKSSTKNALYAILKDYLKVKKISGNSETGIPLGILGFNLDGFSKKDWFMRLLKSPLRIGNLKGVEYLVIEMGIDDPYPPKNMSYLLSIVKPDMSIDLNATATHTEQFEKTLKRIGNNDTDFLVKKIAQEDSKIITNGHTKIGIYNKDDQNITIFVEKKRKRTTLKLLSFGTSENNDISYSDYLITTNKTKFSFYVNVDSKKRLLELVFSNILLPPAARESFAAVILASLKLGLKPSQIKESIEKNFSIPKGRSSLFLGIKDSLIIDSSYNSSKASVMSFLELLETLKKKTNRKIVFVMGDMRELGNQAKSEHEEIAKRLVEVVDELYCVGPLTHDFVMPIAKMYVGKKKMLERVEWYKNVIQAGLHLKEELIENSIILIKGSQNTIFLEEGIKFLLKNPSDIKNLVRQDDYWMKEKKAYFKI